MTPCRCLTLETLEQVVQHRCSGIIISMRKHKRFMRAHDLEIAAWSYVESATNPPKLCRGKK